jgi:hypothetical protein
MKSIKLLLAALVVLMMLPVSGFALVDVGVYGGYSMATMENGSSSDVNGYEYGVFGHYNTGLPMLFSIGIGGFYQISNLTIDEGDLDATRKAYGFDLMATLELPIIIHPFIRGGIAISESFDIEGDSNSESFESYYVGIGAGITIFPMIRIFAEYIYSTSELEGGDYTLGGNAFHVGAMLSI